MGGKGPETMGWGYKQHGGGDGGNGWGGDRGEGPGA